MKRRTMDAEEGVKWATEWTRYSLQLAGLWPNPSASDASDGKYRLFFTVLLTIIFMIGPQSAHLIRNWGDLDLMTDSLSTANIPVLNTVMKMFFIWHHRNALRPLLSSFDEDWHRDKMADERSTMLKNALAARKISIGLNVLTQTTLVVYVFLRLAEIIMIEDRTSVDPIQCTLYPSIFPYDNRKSPMFEFTCLGQILTVVIVSISYTGIDSFACMLIFHARGQYVNLGETLRRLFDKNIGTKFQKDVNTELRAIIKRHNHLNWFSITIEESFNLLLFIQMLCSTVQLCLQGFQVLKTVVQNSEIPTVELIFLGLYVAVIALHLYLYCYVGEMLLEQSSAIGHCAYESRWYNARPCDVKDLMMVMRRSMVPNCLTAGKFTTFCLQTFGSILRSSMGYLSVLVAVSATVE